MVWMFLFPQIHNWNIEIQVPDGIVSGVGDFERCLGHEGGAPMMGLEVLYKRPRRIPFLPLQCQNAPWKSATQERALTWPCWHSDLGLPASRTLRNTFLLVIHCSLWHSNGIDEWIKQHEWTKKDVLFSSLLSLKLTYNLLQLSWVISWFLIFSWILPWWLRLSSIGAISSFKI